MAALVACGDAPSRTDQADSHDGSTLDAELPADTDLPRPDAEIEASEIGPTDTGELADTIDDLAPEPTDGDGDGGDSTDGRGDGDGADDTDDAAGDATDASDGDAALPSACDAATRCAHGRVLRDHRAVATDPPRLLPVEARPVARWPIVLRLDGRTVARGHTDANGNFALPFPRDAASAPEILVSAIVSDGDGAPLVVVLDADGVPLPTSAGQAVRAERVWSWIAGPELGDDFGDVRIDEAAGAGALALLDVIVAARARAVAALGPEPEPSSLALFWNPTLTPPCLSCYLPGGWGPVTWAAPDGDVTFTRAMFLSGAPAAPLHFAPSLPAHELGHWVLDRWSRFPAVGGAHGWDQLVEAPLAWSEGFATFFGQWSQSSAAAPMPRFFSIQGGVSYWIDIDAIGRSPRFDDASFNLELPLPDEDGGLDQAMNEGVVAAILWDLWDEVGELGADGARDDVALGDEALVAIADARFFGLDRGAFGPDLVDHLDALACRAASEVGAWASVLLGMPWSLPGSCPAP